MDRPLVHCHGDSAPCLVAGLHYQDQNSGLGTSLEVATYFQLMNYMTCIILIMNNYNCLIILC